jgi:3-hydroxyacyl-CoA dehydrogenase
MALMFLAGGHNVHIRDPSADQLSAALSYISATLPSLTSSLVPGTAHTFSSLSEAVENAWLVIEAIPEVLSLKISTFAELAALAPKDCVLATNSSSYKSSAMIEEVPEVDRARVLNMHFFMPPAKRVVELMTCGVTHHSIFPFLYEELTRINMSPVVVKKESTGFLFNRIWAAIKRECLTVIAEGVGSPEDIDGVWTQMFNSPEGPCTLMDQVGLDTVAHIESHYISERGFDPSARDFVVSEYVAKGKLGKKSPSGGLYPPQQEEVPARGLYILDLGLTNLSAPMSSGRVLAGSIDGKTPLRTLSSSESLPDGITTLGNRLYWTSMGPPSTNTGSIRSSTPSGEDITTILPPGKVHTPKQITADRTNNYLYVSDREGMRVLRFRPDGEDLTILVKNGDCNKKEHRDDQMRWCVGIAVDPVHRLVYWSQKGPSKGGQGRIMRASLDIPKGETAETRTDIEILFSSLPEPTDLEIDTESETLYWCDRGELPLGNTVNCASVALGERKVAGKSELERKLGYKIILAGLHEAIGLQLDVANGFIYASDLGGSVYRFNIDGSGKQKLYEAECAFAGIALA